MFFTTVFENMKKRKALFVGLAISMVIFITGIVGIPLYIRRSSQKADSEQKAKIQAKIDSFSSSLEELEKSELKMDELDKLAEVYEKICSECFNVSNFPACTSFITKNGLADKLTSLKPKAELLIKDLDSKQPEEKQELLEKLLNFGLVDAKEILEFITKLEAPLLRKSKHILKRYVKSLMKGKNPLRQRKIN